ncbi:beta family protein [Acidomonas methanolica]|uniref:Beta protein n=1 Tax=Acidomonas methanolica NBRC 104435 TaxID=1231351 RepID=A0A023D690_ACIMT|nr:hypothetical protein [Acidomonas methanolica]TCS19084.1 T4 beta protein [Acidomonas methanolica]GAJ29614.1 hypothetical protein Amme_070_002 [Acidomonas methanolica NBRC 104435]GBQ48526.1 hypothetical protein AA0498_0779 [Acidomonas methanolica]GEL00690.1 hypothetical protein AME01nite_31880 [Acidomonas methanolica NBRC 104435]
MLENFPYCPTLYARVAEMKALSQLPASTKDRIFPLIVARPWPNAKKLEKTWEKITSAIGKRRFALDLDISKKNVQSDAEACQEFRELFDPQKGFASYYKLVSEIPYAIPVLRISGGTLLNLDEQIKHIEALDRGVVVRIEFGSVQNYISILEKILKKLSDFSIFVDLGWSRDIIGREMWASGIVEFVSRDRPETELVISGSSFPDKFSNLGDRGKVSIEERIVYNSLVRRHNAAILIYGDWGSTRPPSPPSPMKNVPRIDLPESGDWISFRQDQELDATETYSEIAQRVITDSSWPADLDIWGTYTIKWTANGEPGAIRSPSTAAAARINIHLHRQAMFGGNDMIVDGDEPFLDEI